MRLLTLFLVALMSSTSNAVRDFPGENIVEARDCILQILANKRNLVLSAEKPLPKVKPEGLYTLQDFQDSAEMIWGFRPEHFTNLYNFKTGDIFIFTDRSYYEKHERSVYDSLAHELTHYIQHRYYNADLSEGSDVLEFEAVDVQTWFRETYRLQFQGDRFICPRS